MNSRISLTGGSGFVGQNLIPYLESLGSLVKIISRDDLLNNNVNNFKDCDVFIHLAGKAHDLKKVSNPEEYYKVNFELTKMLYDTFLKSNAKKFLFISSVKASADVVSDVLHENHNANPQTDYGKSKLMAEEYIREQLLPEGKSYFILRPCMIHGPGNKGNLNLLFNVVSKGIPYPLGAFENKRSFLSIANLNFIIAKLIESDIVENGIYNVSDDEALSTNQVIRLISEIVGVKSRLWRVNSRIILLLARLGDYFKLPLNSDRLQKLTESYVVSNEKIKCAIGIKELPVSALKGLSTTIKSFSTKL